MLDVHVDVIVLITNPTNYLSKVC